MSAPVKFLFFVCASLVLIAAVPGCSGCRNPFVRRDNQLKDIDEEEEKKKEKPKPNVEFELAKTIPNGGAEETPRMLVKPGHWMSVQHEIRANNFDINADLRTASTNQAGVIYPVENTEFSVASYRPAPLPKGQLKSFESVFFVPKVPSGTGTGVWFQGQLRSARGGGLIGLADTHPTVAMHDFQYFFVVLASEPDRYGYLKVMSSVRTPSAEVDLLSDDLHFYRVQLPQIDRIAPVPSHSLTWSTIAYLLWDDLDTQVLTEEQEVALLDWLHWGGQLIISGPKSLPKLQGTFLEPYLPAQAVASRQISDSDIDEINEYWSLEDPKTRQLRSLAIPPAQPMLGIQLANHVDARPLPNTAGTVVERRVGRGRIVVTAFSLTDDRLLRWQSFDSFFNACLLRRPRRSFEDRDGVPHTVWADARRAPLSDARLSTRLRYFSRDVGHFSNALAATRRPEQADTAARRAVEETAQRRRSFAHKGELEDAGYLQGFGLPGGTGVAAWNDRSGASDAARESLRDAAGISVPRGEFVLQVLAVYLLVLAPLNWAIFRFLGRVEWAWIAAPVIAIIGAFAVIRLAQLDIGFARSITELSVAEVYQGYPRAHVTRYTALYSSLSTSYEVGFEDPDSLIQPFGAREKRQNRNGPVTVNLRRQRELTLRGLQVSSNTTGIVHCEQFCDLGGAFELRHSETQGDLLENGTGWTLRDVGVLRRGDDGTLQAAWVGDLESGSTVTLDFAHKADNAPFFSQWNASEPTRSLMAEKDRILKELDTDDDGNLSQAEAAADPEIAANFTRLDFDGSGIWQQQELLAWCRKQRSGAVSVGELVDLASRGLRLRPGDSRMIGWSDRMPPQRTIRPATAQTNVRTLFVVHLGLGPVSPPLPDLNCRADVDRLPFESSNSAEEADDGFFP